MSRISESLHNQVIPYSALKLKFPDRQSFIDAADAAKVNAVIKNKQPLHFLPTYLMETHMQDAKYEKSVYKIVLMGILRDGRRINVILDNITPFFEVQLPDERSAQEQEIDKITSLLEADETTSPITTSIINAKPFKYYRSTKAKFIRLYYNKLKNRTAAIKIIRSHGYTTTSDDTASYYRVVCRDNLTTFSSWVLLHDYKFAEVDSLKGTSYRLDIKNYKPFTDELTGDLLKDKTMSCGWDIETWSDSGDVPMPTNKDDKMFCVSMTFQQVNEKEPFLKVCLCDYPANAKEGYLTIVCGSESNIIKAFADVFEQMQPEFIIGFNDSDYDWNWLIKRASQYRGLLSYIANKMDSTKPFTPYTDDGVFKWNFKKERVKVEADTYIDGYALMMHGYIPIDVRTIFRRLYPTAEKSSLQWFLAKNMLGGKEDMPYQEMFKIYKEFREFMTVHMDEASNVLKGHDADLPIEKWDPAELSRYNELKKKMMAINYYCVIDAQRCHDLMKIRSVIMDHREVSNLAYTSVYDAFYRANGMKVRNLTIAIGQGKYFGMRFSNISNEITEEGKYPGAFVLPPRKGLKIPKLNFTERISKANLTKNLLAPSCQEWLNTQDDEITTFSQIVEKYGATGTPELISTVEAELSVKLPKKFKEFWLEPIGRPITGLDFSSLYPSLIRAYNFSPEKCILDKKQAQAIAETGQRITKVDFDFHGTRKVAYFVWHNNKYDPTDEKFQFGVYPYILDDLFNKRAILKKKMKVFVHRKEEIDAMSEEEQAKVVEEYEDVVFNYNYLNCKQNALKVFMNTFYGEAGNKRSPFFVMEVAGGITSYGQKNIRFAYAFVREKGCGVYYGDSVAENTPILVRQGGFEGHCEICYLVPDIMYKPYNDCKEIAQLKDCYVWSDLGWTAIKHVIRHKTNKRMFRVVTDRGEVDVTEDHSLLTPDGTPIKPNELLVNSTKLMVSEKPPIHKKLPSNGNDYAIVTKYYELPATTSYVYDLETANHHFSAGRGDLVVHNTDSLYLSTPEQFFEEADKAFYSGKLDKLDYWTSLVETTFNQINPIRDGVNKAFIEDNGTKFLSMAYEEVLFPVAFTAKKKYFGIAHENIANFKPKELFIRGLEVKKRGVSDLLRKIFMEIMWASCSTENVYDLVELVLMKIDEIYSRQWTAHDFFQTGVYRPGRKNVKINTFVARMKERNIDIKPNERFNYVIVKKYPYSYDHRGRKVALSIGDKLELAEEYEKQGMEIDLDYYMQGSINGQLARLITYHEMFKVDPVDTSDEEIKIAEDRIYKNACKFIEDYCKKYYASYNTFGKTHQAIFKQSSKAISTIIKEQDELVASLISANVDNDDFEAWFVEYTEKKADKMVVDYGRKFILKELADVTQLVTDKYDNIVDTTDVSDDNPTAKETTEKALKAEIRQRRKEKLQMLQSNYYGGKESIIEDRELNYKNTMSILRKRLRENFQAYMKAYRKYNTSVEHISELLRGKIGSLDDLMKPSKESIDYKLEDFDLEEGVLTDEVESLANEKVKEMINDAEFIRAINNLKWLHNNMLSAHVNVKKTREIVQYLKAERDHENKAVVRPDKATMDRIIKQSINDINDEVLALDI